ncbi:nanos homolog 1-like [Diadema antillarum]|uniref:nanos homolog 1-like n=1 Tax=Diadema antillarum TaxID=105358 RepID=UPI003A871ADD
MDSGRPLGVVSWCAFCKNNRESELVYARHQLKSQDGRTTCPILRAHRCPICGANGDDVHTIKYYPLSKEQLPGDSPTGPGAISRVTLAGLQYRTPQTYTGQRKRSSGWSITNLL